MHRVNDVCASKHKGVATAHRALIGSGCFVIEFSFGPQLTSTKGCYCMCSVGGRDRVGFHIIVEDLFDVASRKTSNHCWCLFQRNIATRSTILSASGRVTSRHTLPIAVSNEVHLSNGFRNIQHHSCGICFISRNSRIHCVHWETISCIRSFTLNASILYTEDTGTLA